MSRITGNAFALIKRHSKISSEMSLYFRAVLQIHSSGGEETVQIPALPQSPRGFLWAVTGAEHKPLLFWMTALSAGAQHMG